MLSAASSTFGPPAPSCRLELRLYSPHISVRICFLPPPSSLKRQTCARDNFDFGMRKPALPAPGPRAIPLRTTENIEHIIHWCCNS